MTKALPDVYLRVERIQPNGTRVAEAGFPGSIQTEAPHLDDKVQLTEFWAPSIAANLHRIYVEWPLTNALRTENENLVVARSSPAKLWIPRGIATDYPIENQIDINVAKAVRISSLYC